MAGKMGTLDLDRVEALEEVGMLEPEIDFKQFLLPGINCMQEDIKVLT